MPTTPHNVSCTLCGREGRRAFALDRGNYICESKDACVRRQLRVIWMTYEDTSA